MDKYKWSFLLWIAVLIFTFFFGVWVCVDLMLKLSTCVKVKDSSNLGVIDSVNSERVTIHTPYDKKYAIGDTIRFY